MSNLEAYYKSCFDIVFSTEVMAALIKNSFVIKSVIKF